jgi:hypothetical protein
MPGLGRLFAPDPNDHRFLLPARRLEAKTLTRRTWTAAGVLDQGESSACVGFSSWMFLATSPIRNHPNFTPMDLYGYAQDEDEWPGKEPEVQGSSVRGAMKALQKRGLVSQYNWGFDCETVIDHVLTVGPVVMGTNWYDSMFDPDVRGYLNIDGRIAGGHAWLILGADRERKNPDGTVGAVRMLNSWGRGWGQAGRAYLTFAAIDRLLSEDGEAAVATEVLGNA